ncbi:MAG: peptidase S10 [Acidobacteria bacterium]|nr:peptidase S10 [Acidobacteriota bacterium]
MTRRNWISALLFLILTVPAITQEKPGASDEKKPVPEERAVTTEHQVTIDGSTIRYQATAGTYILEEEDGTPKAEIFYIAYHRLGVSDSTRRPLTFSYNGGPGSSSVWLHLGVLGPRRVDMGEEGNAPRPPYRVTPNPYSLLDVTDIVFIDPVMTGYSRPVAGEDKSQFTGLREDVRAVGEFIRLYVNRNERWGSPKFLIGESYGTTRSAALSNWLQERHGMYLNGVMLISSILDFQTARFDVGNDLPYILFLPTYTATAWYHGQLESSLQQMELRDLLTEVETFALNDYTLALMQGNDLPEERKRDIANRLAHYTGLSSQYVLDTNLRIQIHRFTKELRRSERITVGRLDSRFTGTDYDAAGESYEYDPSYAEILGPYSGALKHYLTSELGFQTQVPYEILTGRVRPWSYEEFEGRYVNVADELRQAMTRNPDLQVFVANGYYDLATPYFATEYTFDHLSFDPGFEERIRMEYYESGHMMYIHQPSLLQLRKDLVDFVRQATQ